MSPYDISNLGTIWGHESSNLGTFWGHESSNLGTFWGQKLKFGDYFRYLFEKMLRIHIFFN
jgi:hypothetical protein